MLIVEEVKLYEYFKLITFYLHIYFKIDHKVIIITVDSNYFRTVN